MYAHPIPDIGLVANKYIEKGQLVPDDITVKLITNELSRSYKNVNWLLDGKM